MLNKTVVAMLAVASASAVAKVGSVSVSFEQVIEAPRWMFDDKAKVKGGPLFTHLVEIKKALADKNRGACLTAVGKAYGLGKSLGSWIAWNQLQCAQLRDKNGKIAPAALAQALKKVEAQPSWLLNGPASPLLRTAYTSGLLALAEYQFKTDRRAAWSTLDKLQQVRSWLTAEDRANAYRWAGELAFIEQNLGAAQDFLLRSLSERESAELRTRVESIRSQLLGRKKDAPASVAAAKSEAKTPADDLGISDEERELFARLNRSYESQDYISAIEDGIQLINKYPGSKRAADASERILDIYLSLANRTDEKFRHVRERGVKEMAKADAARLSRWANNAYARGNYLDALNLAEKAYLKYAGHPDSTKVLLLAGKAAVASGEYTDAQAHLERVLQEHGGTPEASEATFRLGLLEFRRKKYGPAAGYFERLLALKTGEDFEYQSLYWQWRAQQRIDAAKAAPYAEALIKKYPLSYYGLRAQAELGGGSVQLANKPVNLKVDLRLLPSEQLAFERLQILLKAGWFREAERELEVLPAPGTNEERLVHARYWAAAMRYDLAVQHMNKAFEENPELLQIGALNVVFPQEYATWISRESKSAGVHEDWIRSVIRQESSFRPEARSSANAMGVMQLLPSTAQELVRDLKIKDFQAESLFSPDVNIKIGSTYLSRLIRSFNGHIPLAIAAYNAGPTRLRRWLNARKDLSPLEGSPTSSPDVEVWIDELPWTETSFYVKAVLRNYLIYRLLDGSKLSLSEPIWVDAKPVAR